MRALRLAFLSLLLLGGCLYHAREATDETVRELAAMPFDLAPSTTSDAGKSTPSAEEPAAPAKEVTAPPAATTDVQTTAFMEAQPISPKGQELFEKRTRMPVEIPGAEAPRFEFAKMTEKERKEAIRKWYPELAPLPSEPTAQPGPGGNPYSLADLQQIAAANSPTLRQAASDVEAAWGNLIQARAYPNPRVGYTAAPSSDGSTPGTQGLFVDQVVSFGGKIKLTAAAAEMDLRNAELALRRARSDLATAVRNAYFAVLVARETVVVNTALAKLTDNIYRVQVDVSETLLVAPYEPGALRAQAYVARLALKGSLDTYVFSWKQLAATIGMRQLPLSELAGRIDAVLPYYEFDAVRDYALRNHTDVLTARNGIDRARFNLKRAQITPYSDVEFSIGLSKDFVLPPHQVTPNATVGWTLPIWDQNRGAIRAAEAALVRAGEEPHRVEIALTNSLAAAYLSYKVNIDSVEYYRRYILPDQVRTYIGIRDRYYTGEKGGVTFADVVSAQQTLATNITTYLGLLGTLWSSTIAVADFLQTDDLFQLAKPLGVAQVPQLEPLPPWPCGHSSSPLVPGARCAPGGCMPANGKMSMKPEERATSPAIPERQKESDANPERKQASVSAGLEDSARPTTQAPSSAGRDDPAHPATQTPGTLPDQVLPPPPITVIPKPPESEPGQPRS
jgi:cobalt-zinc-cadmium efflux system outer membrane protein